jgi:hypothetical protein
VGRCQCVKRRIKIFPPELLQDELIIVIPQMIIFRFAIAMYLPDDPAKESSLFFSQLDDFTNFLKSRRWAGVQLPRNKYLSGTDI